MKLVDGWRVIISTLVLALGGASTAADEVRVAPEGTTGGAQRIGPPTFSMAPWNHLAEPAPGPGAYPIPRDEVTRDTYLHWIGETDLINWARRHAGGFSGPSAYLAVLAQFVATGDPELGEATVAMLKEVERLLSEGEAPHNLWVHGGHTHVMGLYRRYLAETGLLDAEQDEWFRDLILTYNRGLHIWGQEQWFYRGPGYRAQNEGISRGLAALWYPDALEAEEWREYAETVYNDWWKHKDLPANDTGYYYGALGSLMVHAWLRGDEEFFRHARMQQMWDRLMYEVTPDGAVCPWGASSGWNASAPSRIWMLELLASQTGDGRYRFVAHKLMNYLRYQQETYFDHWYLRVRDAGPSVALAYLFADDSIAPVEPEAGSLVLYHNEALTIKGPKEGAEPYLGELDPAPDRGHVCHYTVVTDRVLPSKLVFRSGWNPGDLFALIEVFPRIGHMHDSLNPGAILGMTRWGTPLTHELNTKFGAQGCRLQIKDLGGTAPLRANRDPMLRDPYYMEVTIPEFADLSRASVARVVFSDYMGYPAEYSREFIFVKNRFLVARDLLTFEESFLAEVAPVFHTQHVGPLGDHWANTYFSEARTQFVGTYFRVPPYELLAFFAPRPDSQLEVVDRTATEARAFMVPGQVRYRRQGIAQPGETWHFTQVYYPHPHATVTLASQVNLPGTGIDHHNPGATGVDRIEVLTDEVTHSVLRFTLDENRVEWVVGNPSGAEVQAGGLATDARYLYLDMLRGEMQGAAAVGATRVALEGAELFRAEQPSEWQR